MLSYARVPQKNVSKSACSEQILAASNDLQTQSLNKLTASLTKLCVAAIMLLHQRHRPYYQSPASGLYLLPSRSGFPCDFHASVSWSAVAPSIFKFSLKRTRHFRFLPPMNMTLRKLSAPLFPIEFLDMSSL